jgi:hypothetical protein
MASRGFETVEEKFNRCKGELRATQSEMSLLLDEGRAATTEARIEQMRRVLQLMKRWAHQAEELATVLGMD